MKDRPVDRRTFMGMLGAGSATLLSAPRLIATTECGVLIESDSEYGGFLVEKLSSGSFPYECDESVLQRMSEKFNVFSRNRWDPERTEILDAAEDMSERNLVELEGREPNQTRLDYAFMAAAWCHAAMGGGHDYGWDTSNGMLMEAGLDEMKRWDPAAFTAH